MGMETDYMSRTIFSDRNIDRINQQRRDESEKRKPILDWSKAVVPQLEPAGKFDAEAKVMSEMDVRAVVIRALAECGITPRTTE